MIKTSFCLLDLKECPVWDEWSEWSSCSASCGGGLRRRERTCVNGYPGNSGCLGDQKQQGACNTLVSVTYNVFLRCLRSQSQQLPRKTLITLSLFPCIINSCALTGASGRTGPHAVLLVAVAVEAVFATVSTTTH